MKSGARFMVKVKDTNRKKRSDGEKEDLNRMLRETMEALGRTRKDITFRHRLRQSIPTVKIDEAQLTQFLQDLLGNLTDAMSGGGTLTVETSVAGREEARNHIPQPDSDIHVRLWIRCRKERPFVNGTESEPAFVCPAPAADGVHVTTVPGNGEGTTVIVHLPVSAGEASRFISAHSEVMIKSGGTETILIVDDDGNVIDTVRDLLKALGYSVLTASSGDEALSTYRRQKGRIDLVLLDFMMPGMNGDEAFRQLKSIDPRVRVILMSGNNVEEDLRELLSLGFDAILKKPFKVYELTKVLRSVLERSA
jgi:CheY-like chemotaxis protein